MGILNWYKKDCKQLKSCKNAVKPKELKLKQFFNFLNSFPINVKIIKF